MMNPLTEHTLDYLHTLHIPPKGSSDKVHAVYKAAVKHGAWLEIDYQTVQDLCGLFEVDGDVVRVLLLQLFKSLQEGSLCLPVELRELTAQLTWLGENATGYAEAICQGLKENAWPTLVGSDAGSPLLLQQSGNDSLLYFQKQYLQERTLIHHLDRVMNSTLRYAAASEQKLADVIDEVCVQMPSQLHGHTMKFDDGQFTALVFALRQPLTVISGGPGTGKTSILFTLLRCLLRLDVSMSRVALAAPTGRAAQRMKEFFYAQAQATAEVTGHEMDTSLTEIQSTTLHRLLGYRPGEKQFRYHENNPLPYDVIVVDEVSMVDLELMSALLSAVADGARVVLIGDPGQLPSVEAGAVLADLIPDIQEPVISNEMKTRLQTLRPSMSLSASETESHFQDRVAVLTQGYRSGETLSNLAASLRTGEEDWWKAMQVHAEMPLSDWLQESVGCYLLDQNDGDRNRLYSFVEGWMKAQFEGPYCEALQRLHSLGNFDLAAEVWKSDLASVFDVIDIAQILCALREGVWGAAGINRFAQQWLRQAIQSTDPAKALSGMPVLITRNAPAMGLFNGDIGVQLQTAEGLRVIFRRGVEYVSYAPSMVPALQPAFAMTVHKSQGSEYDRVLLILPPAAEHRLMTRELLYTGLTRARHHVTLWSSEAALQSIATRQNKRHSGLAAWWRTE